MESASPRITWCRTTSESWSEEEKLKGRAMGGWPAPGGPSPGDLMQGQGEATLPGEEAMLREGWECRVDRWTREKWLDPVTSERACRG